MTTVERRSKMPRSPDAQRLVQKLERTIRNLNTLKNHLNSYSCEPRTASLFEQKFSLSRDLDSMTTKSAAVLYDLRIAEKPLEDPMGYIAKQQKKFQELEKKVLDYIGRAKFLS